MEMKVNYGWKKGQIYLVVHFYINSFRSTFFGTDNGQTGGTAHSGTDKIRLSVRATVLSQIYPSHLKRLSFIDRHGKPKRGD